MVFYRRSQRRSKQQRNEDNPQGDEGAVFRFGLLLLPRLPRTPKRWRRKWRRLDGGRKHVLRGRKWRSRRKLRLLRSRRKGKRKCRLRVLRRRLLLLLLLLQPMLIGENRRILRSGRIHGNPITAAWQRC